MPQEDEAALALRRRQMVETLAVHFARFAPVTGRASPSPRVLEAMNAAPRHLFVPDAYSPLAYEDAPLPIGEGKTISQPFMVALACELVGARPGTRILEIGAGLGYQAAVLAELGCAVCAVEILPELHGQAARRLEQAGYEVKLRLGDGARGWPEEAPFDGIIVSAAGRAPPDALIEQLAPGGKLVMPVGDEEEQRLFLFWRDPAGRIGSKPLIAVRYSGLTLPS